MADYFYSRSEYINLLQFHWARYIKFEYEKNPKEVKRKIYSVCEKYPEIDKAWKLKKLFECHAFNVEFMASEHGDRLRAWEEKARKKWKGMEKFIVD